MANYEEFKELRAISGEGAGLYVKGNDGFYSFLIPLETIPSVAGTPTSIDVDVTTSSTIGKISGKTTLDDKEAEFFLHRDNLDRIEKYSHKTYDFLIVFADYTGWGFSASIKYKPNDIGSKDATKGTITFTPSSIDETHTRNVFSLLKPTCKFVDIVDARAEIRASGTHTSHVVLFPTTATLEVTSDTSNITVSKTAGANGIYDVTITANAACKTGESAIITYTATAVGHAPWETTTLVIIL